jgi:hypothetical protein
MRSRPGPVPDYGLVQTLFFGKNVDHCVPGWISEQVRGDEATVINGCFR